MAPRTLSHRVGVIGDIHAEDTLLELALERFAELEVATVLCTGDITDGSGSAQRCCDLLAARAVATVRGNHDRWIVDGALRTLPEATAIDELDASAREYLERWALTAEDWMRDRNAMDRLARSARARSSSRSRAP